MRRTPSIVMTSVAAVAVAAAGAITAVSPASAATAAVGCSATDAAIYAPPASVTAASGSVLQCESTALPQLDSANAFSAWKVQYATSTLTGAKTAATGTVIVPTAAWTGGGSRPLVAFNPGTLGLGTQCALSRQLSGAYQDEYENSNLNALLKAGYAVAAADGLGYMNGQVHPYVVGVDSGHALLDAARSALVVPGSGLSATTKVGIWGYSEGGGASLWATQLAASYAGNLNVVGDASGGVPGELKSVASQLNGGAFAGFLVDAVVGLSSAYPQLPFTSLLNASGVAAVKSAKTVCLLGTVASFAGAKLESYTTAGLTLDQIYALKGTDGSTWSQAVDAQRLGVGVGGLFSSAKYRITFPTFQYRGAAEEVVNTKAEDGTRAAYCSAGVTTQWNAGYPGEHLTTDAEAVGDVISWLGDRFAGKFTLGNC